MSSDDPRSAAAPESYLGPRITAVLVTAAGIVAIIGGLGVREAGGFSVIGPKQFPIAVGVGLVVLGLTSLAVVTFWPDRELGRAAAREDRMTHWPTAGAAIAALVVYAIALFGLGYVVATAPFFALHARILGSRKPVRDALIGLGLSVVLYFGFTRFLGVQLPTGPVESLLGG